MIDVLDLGPKPGRIGRHVVLQRRRNVDEASSHAFLLSLLARLKCARHYSFRAARRAPRNTLATSVAGNASVSMRPTSQPGATTAKRECADEGDRAKDGRRQKLVIDEQVDQLLDDCADHAGAAALGLRSATRPQGDRQEQRDKRKDRDVAARPCDAKALAGPEQAEGREHHSDREFERILGDARERPMDCRAYGRDRDTGRQRARAREPKKPATRPDGDDNERDLDPLQQHGLEGGRAGDPVQPVRPPLWGFGQCARLAREGGVLVVQSDDSDRPQDRLAQPAQAEHEQQDADRELQGVKRNGAQQRPEGDDDQRECGQRGRGAGQRRAPAAREPDGEHDGQRLDRLDE